MKVNLELPNRHISFDHDFKDAAQLAGFISKHYAQGSPVAPPTASFAGPILVPVFNEEVLSLPTTNSDGPGKEHAAPPVTAAPPAQAPVFQSTTEEVLPLPVMNFEKEASNASAGAEPVLGLPHVI